MGNKTLKTRKSNHRKDSKNSKKNKGHNTPYRQTKKGQLFGDDNPATTVTGYGFGNATIANYTLDDLKYRDIDYQFQVVNTMYHRAISVMKRTQNKNKQQDISNAAQIFKTWLDDYKKRKRGQTDSKPYMTHNQVSKLEFLAEFYEISEKARGLQKPTKSDKGFKVVWETSVERGGAGGDKKQLRNMPIKASIPHGQTWDKHRNQYLERRLSMIKNDSNGLYYAKGPYKGLPTKLHVNMIMWAYSPDQTNILNNIDKYKKIIRELQSPHK